MKIAIHQPNFVPWLGLFHKAAMADRFVLLDHVQAQRGRSWMTRNRILVDGQPRWLTMPIEHPARGLAAVNEVRVQWENRLVSKQLRTLGQAYGRHPYFDEVYSLISELYAARPPLIAELNVAFIVRVLARLGLSVELVSSAELSSREPRLLTLHGNDLLIALCHAAGGDEYICGEGSTGYIDPPEFEAQGIAFWFQRYVHPEYEQRGARAFVSHLSVLDALFNVGFEGVPRLVEHEARVRPGARTRSLKNDAEPPMNLGNGPLESARRCQERQRSV
jgi:hypothetical protein